MRLLHTPLILFTLALAGPVHATGLNDVAITNLPGWSAAPAPLPSQPKLLALIADPTDRGAVSKPRGTRLLSFTRGSERATVFYLEYAGEADAQKALPRLRTRLWGSEAPPEGPRLLRAGNMIAVVEARTLTVTLAVSRRLTAAGAVQDAADVSPRDADPDEAEAPAKDSDAGSGTLPRLTDAPSLDAVDPAVRAQAASLGRYMDTAAEADKLLQAKRYGEALVAYRRYLKRANADRGAGDAVVWDAAQGLGLAAAYSGHMPEARGAFVTALKSAARLDARKLAETYFNLACAEAELKNKAAAIQALRGCMAAARRAGGERVFHYQQSIRTDHSLRSVQGDPAVKKMLSEK